MAARTAFTSAAWRSRGCRVLSQPFVPASGLAWRAPAARCSPFSCPQLPRGFQSSTGAAPAAVPDFAFAFDIDGVLLRSSDPIPRASGALRKLQSARIPFILLTNGGGKLERDRVQELSEKLDLPLDVGMFVQSHTPFATMDEFKDKTILVVGGDGEKCRSAASSYGFKSVVTPGDLFVAHPELWPFSSNFNDYYRQFAKPLPRPIDPQNPSDSLQLHAIYVYNDPRDWGLDATIIIDALLSSQGRMGTLSPKNNRPDLPNRGFQQDNQPPLYFSNPDLWWAAKYHLPRLGQGGFRESLEGLWAAITGGPRAGVELKKTVIGKPFHPTYEFAEKRLLKHRHHLFGSAADQVPLKRVYMVGDNPESDIRGGNTYDSAFQSVWKTALVRTGVYDAQSEPAWTPTVVVDDVHEAVEWAMKDSKWT